LHSISWLEQTATRYIREKARASLDGEPGSLAKFWAAGPAGRRGLKQVAEEREALRRAEETGRFRYIKVEATVQLGPPETAPRGVLLPIRERLDRWYEKEGQQASYALVRTHRTLWVPRGDDWALAEDEAGQEGRRLAPLRPVLGSEPGPHEEQSQGSGGGPAYRRGAAVDYAERWWDGYNPEYRAFDVDCTSFISQCLAAGDAPQWDTGRQDMGWWYRRQGGPQDQWSLSWAVAHSLRWYLAGSRQALQAEQVKDPRLLQPGDVIHYDFDGDGVWEHTTMVVDLDPGGEPLVNAHTAPSRRRPWRYADSPAWTSRTRYLFWRVRDRF